MCIAHGLWGQAKFSEVEPGPFATLVRWAGVFKNVELTLFDSSLAYLMFSGSSSSFTPISTAS